MQYTILLQPVFRSSWGSQPRPKYEMPAYQSTFATRDDAVAEGRRVLALIAADPIARSAGITMSAHITDDMPLTYYEGSKSWEPLEPFTRSGV